MAFFSQEFQYAIGWTVIHSLWQATAIALLSGVVMIVLRKKTAQTRYIVHNVALFSVLVVAAVTFSLYFQKAKIHTVNATNVVTTTPSVQTGETTESATKVSVDIPNVFKISVETGQPEIENPKPEIGSPLSIEGMKAYFDSHIYFVVLVWLMGVGLFLLKLLGGISYVYYLRSQHNFPVDEYWV